VACLVSGLSAALNRQIDLNEYLIWSTVIAVFMFFHLTGTFQVGYVVVLVNTLVLLTFDRIAIHRSHMAAILALAGFGLIGTLLSGTPLTAPASQILGISAMSIYFFCALTSFGLSLSRWMELYMRAALALTVFAIANRPILSISRFRRPAIACIATSTSGVMAGRA
jgi:hypothetical protein